MEDEEYSKQLEIGNYIINLKRIKDQGLLNDYLAINKNEKKYYICKIIPKNNLENQSDLDKIRTTISIHKNINHDNIVNLYDYDEDEDFLYIFLDFIDGKTLYKILKLNKKYKFEEKEIYIIIEQVINLLIYLYNQKIILKDLILQNIYIQKNEQENEKTHILLCNVEHTALLSRPETKDEIEKYNNEIVFKLGIIICELLDNKFYKYFEKNINNQDLINKYIINKILKNCEITNYLKKLIEKMIPLGNKSRILLEKIIEDEWFIFYKQMKQEKKEKKEKKSNNEFINNTSVSSKNSKISNKNNVKEEIIITDEEYLELYKKDKEVLLGLIDSFDRDEFIQTIQSKKKYEKIYNSNNNVIEDSVRTNDNNEKITYPVKRRGRNDKSKDKHKFWKCF